MRRIFYLGLQAGVFHVTSRFLNRVYHFGDKESKHQFLKIVRAYESYKCTSACRFWGIQSSPTVGRYRRGIKPSDLRKCVPAISPVWWYAGTGIQEISAEYSRVFEFHKDETKAVAAAKSIVPPDLMDGIVWVGFKN